MTENRARLDQPREERRGLHRPKIDADAFGSAAERLARNFGTARYLSIQSVFVVVWIVFNVVAISLRFDRYPFILLNLAFSTQAAYAAPLILLAQNRQADRDKVQSQADRDEAQQSKADLDYLAREIASIRMALGEVATRDFLRSELSRLQNASDRESCESKDKARRKDKDARPQAKDARSKGKNVPPEAGEPQQVLDPSPGPDEVSGEPE